MALLAVGASAVTPGADSFGRYGYDAFLDLPDLKVSLSGFAPDAAGADQIAFLNPAKSFKVLTTHATAQLVQLEGGAGAPTQARASLIGNCLDLFFVKGAYFRIRSASAPFLSWKEGSVGPQVPTPNLPWVLISFQTPQPPVVFGFSGNKASFEVSGRPGSWVLSDPDFSGWIRVMLPLGLKEASPTDAAGLGRLSADVASDSAIWGARTPIASKVKITASDTAIDAEWSFDSSGVFIPPAAMLAALGGNTLSIQSPHHTLKGGGRFGHYEVSDGSKLVIHFPVHKISPGRAVGLGFLPAKALPAVTSGDVNSVVELAFESLLAGRDSSLSKLCDRESAQYLEGVPYVAEPCTGQQLPFGADGDGLLKAAAHALLAQAALLTVDSNDTNALFDSLLWRRDWWTWTVWAKNPEEGREASALAAVAGAMSNSPTSRLYAATLEAGLDAQSGLALSRNAKASLNEPLLGLREGIFELKRAPDPGLDFYALLQSPLKVSEGPAVALQGNEKDLLLYWPSPGKSVSVMTFFNAPNLHLLPVENLPKFVVSQADRATSITYVSKRSGKCAAKLLLPEGFPRLPREVLPPKAIN